MIPSVSGKEDLKNALVTGVAGTVAGALVLTTAEPLLGPAVGSTIGFLLRSALSLKSADVDRWWSRVVAEEEPARFEEEIMRRADEPAVREVILRSVRALVDAADDAAIEPLARLARMYLPPTPLNPPDAFFRGTARMLGEASREELAGMVEVCRLVLLADSSFVTLAAKQPPGSPTSWIIVINEHDDEQRTNSLSKIDPPRWAGAVAPDRVFSLLERNTLGRSGATLGVLGCLLARETAQRLLTVLLD